MTKNQFFDAFGEIDPAYVFAVDKLLAGSGEKRISISRKNFIRAALIAAVIMGLLTVTAYAAGLFGLQERLIRDPAPTQQSAVISEETEKTLRDLRTVHHRNYLSLSGVNGSPEYRAAAEWLAFKGSYADQMAAEQLEQGKAYYDWRDLERSFAPDEETKEICRLYQVWDGEMWARLQKIAEKYDLKLHTKHTAFPGVPREYGIYEDGSFSAFIEGAAGIGFSYYIYLERQGALPADDLASGSTDEYEEWEYANARGNILSIAVRENDEWALVFYSGDTATVTLRVWYGGVDDIAALENFTDRIDFEAVASLSDPGEILAMLRGENT